VYQRVASSDLPATSKVCASRSTVWINQACVSTSLRP
jgi:hypothetical protein